MNEESTARRVNTTIQEKTYLNVGLLKHDIRVVACWRFKKMHKLPSQCFKEVDMQLGSVCYSALTTQEGSRQPACCLKKHQFVYSIRISRWVMWLSILVLKWQKCTWFLAELMAVNVKHVPETLLASSNSVPKTLSTIYRRLRENGAFNVQQRDREKTTNNTNASKLKSILDTRGGADKS